MVNKNAQRQKKIQLIGQKKNHAKSHLKKKNLSHDFEFNLMDIMYLMGKTFACAWRKAPFECFSRVKIHLFFYLID
jgi:hypothetical protein